LRTVRSGGAAVSTAPGGRTRPVNRLKRAQRKARWDDAAAEGLRNYARRFCGTHPNAKYIWQQYIADTDLPATVKLVALLLSHTARLMGPAYIQASES
jgi:hypothetical protein